MAIAALAERLDVEPERFAGVPHVERPVLPPAQHLLQSAFDLAPQRPEAANLLLAAAMISEASTTSESKMIAALSLLAPLVARADPMRTLGPEGAEERDHLLPGGWTGLITSYHRLRYAWREGLVGLLQPGEGDRATVQALDELTRLKPGEPEPVSVAIQEQWPQPKVAFAVSVLSLSLSLYGLYTSWRESSEVKAELKRRKRQRIRKRASS